ncbi:MAG: PP2C family protein-serine/threonine phosphatase [Ruminiclostridium sp.]|nr:PP2C family protein-serine/threonine phosphatase [Ruminiclostridium sp.]
MKKTKRLAIQVGLIVSLMFVLTISMLAYVVRQGTLQMYMETRNKEIADSVEDFKDLFMSPEIADWVLDQWQSDPGMMSEPMDDIEAQISEDLKYTTDIARNMTMENIEWLTPEVRKSFLKALYNYNIEYFDEKRTEVEFNAVYCLDIRDYDNLYENKKDDIAVIFECSEETEGSGDHGLGTYFGNEDAFTTVALMQTGKYGVDYGDIVFQMLDVSDDENNLFLYLAVSPVFIDGELRYVICVEYDWTSFAHIMNVNLNYIIVWGVLGLLATNLLLIFFIYLKAVRPMVKVNAGVRQYMEDKNSAAAVNNMSGIKAKNEVGRIADSFSELVVEIDRYTDEILTLTGERERVEAELDLAAKIQDDMLPKVFPDRPEFDMYASMTPAKEVGGDFYDFFLIDDDHLGLVIADVSGKGVPAAMFMMRSTMLVKNYAMTGMSPAEVLNKTNASICENNKNKMFVTVWLGILEISTGKLTAANAGHEFPAVRQPDGSFELLKDRHGFVIGLRKNKTYTEYELELPKGATLFVYTDGVPEATNGEKELFKTDRMLEALNKEPDASPERLLGNVHTAVNEFVGEAPQFDDLTMLAITIK